MHACGTPSNQHQSTVCSLPPNPTQVGTPCEGWVQLSQAAALLGAPHKERLTFRLLRQDVCPQLSLHTLQRLVVLMGRQQPQQQQVAADTKQG